MWSFLARVDEALDGQDEIMRRLVGSTENQWLAVYWNHPAFIPTASYWDSTVEVARPSYPTTRSQRACHTSTPYTVKWSVLHHRLITVISQQYPGTKYCEIAEIDMQLWKDVLLFDLNWFGIDIFRNTFGIWDLLCAMLIYYNNWQFVFFRIWTNDIC